MQRKSALSGVRKKLLPAIALLILILTQWNGHAQPRRGITIEKGPHRLSHVLESIERQSRYTFAYNNAHLNLNSLINVSFRNQQLRRALESVFGKSIYEYHIVNRHIVLSIRKNVPYTGQVLLPPHTYWVPVRPRFVVGYRPPEIRPFELPVPHKADLKVNALQLATGTLNLAGEIRLGHQWTGSLSVQWNPWSFGSDGRTRHFALTGEGRYWLDQAFDGWFAGLSASYYNYDAGRFDLPLVKNMDDGIYDGYAFGGGLTAGYRMNLKGKWGVEFTAGAQVLWSKYDQTSYREYPGLPQPLKFKDRESASLIPKFGINFTYRIK